MKIGAWGLLILAGLLEVVWAVGIKYTAGWTRPIPSAIVVVAYMACLYLLALAMRHLPAGTAYSVWVGMGSMGVVLWGILFFDESASLPRLACIGLILAGVIGLRLLP